MPLASSILAFALLMAPKVSLEGFNAIEALTQARNFQKEQNYQAREKNTAEAYQVARTNVQTKVKELVKDVKVDDVDAVQCMPLSQLYALGEMWPEALKSVEKFTDAGSPVEMNVGHSMALTYACEARNQDAILKHTKDIAFTNARQITTFANKWLNQAFYVLQELKGGKEAIRVAEELENRLVTQTVVGIVERNELRAIFAEVLSEAMAEEGDTESALKKIDTVLPLLDEKGTKNMKMLRTRLGLVGKPAPPLVFEKGYGAANAESLKGKVVVYDFFAHWCGPCKSAFPGMRAYYTDLKDKGLEIVGVTRYYGYYGQESFKERDMKSDVEFAKMDEFRKEFQITWPVMFGGTENFAKYGVNAIPFVVVVDKKGIVRKVKMGFDPSAEKAFRTEIEALLAE